MAKPQRRVRCCDTGNQPGDYRWLLEVELVGAVGPPLVVVQMNPSTATDTRSDPTVGKVENWARRNGFASVLFTNLFAIRTPTQDDVIALAGHDYEQAVGSENRRWLLEAAARGPVVAAWGEPQTPLLLPWVRRRVPEVVALIGPDRLRLVGPLSGGRWPRHGRGWNFDPKLGPWDPSAEQSVADRVT